MPNIHLYIAATLDGYIAREDGRLDWLDNLPNPEQSDYGFHDFFAGMDTVVMGRRTYEEILGFGVEWPYKKCISYVATRQPDYKLQTPDTELLNPLSPAAIEELRKQSKKDIWLIGGGELVTAFLDQHAIDELWLFLVPTLIGAGIPLFPGQPAETKWELLQSTPYPNGAVMLRYAMQKKGR